MRRHLPVSEQFTPCLSAILNDEQWAAIAKELRLTPRQAEIVYLVLQAKKDKEVAAELRLGVSTVRMHLRYVFSQLNISDRMELALLVFRRVCCKCDKAGQRSE